jgi:hypothetical protein
MADAPAYPGAPGWVKVFGMIALVVAVVFAVLHVVGRGPGEHRHGERSAPPVEHPAPEGGHR